ncbi:MAG TPA: zinc-binding dehydrogenase [Spirochaetia bacterium]|nr:zinc-binding dehydrogenase [Spirochaetia bacterium]
MKAVQVSRFGGPEVLRVVDLPSPSLSPDAVRIRVAAAGVNFADIQMRMGLYPEAPPVPFVPGYEIAGTITEAGPAVISLKPGNRVLSLCRFGGYATEVVLPAAFVRKIPAGLTDVEAAAVPVAFTTAWILLMDMARVRPGDRVLVPGAAGGVGTAAVQMAHGAGADVVGLVGSSAKKELVLSLGAREVFTYAEWSSTLRPASFDIILEPRGGRDARRSLAFLAPAGRMVCYGVSSFVRGFRRSIPRAALSLLGMPIFTPIGLAMANRGVFGLNILKYFDAGTGILQLGTALDGAIKGFEKGRYRAIVGKTWGLEEAGEAHRRLQSREGTGKQILLE